MTKASSDDRLNAEEVLPGDGCPRKVFCVNRSSLLQALGGYLLFFTRVITATINRSIVSTILKEDDSYDVDEAFNKIRKGEH